MKKVIHVEKEREILSFVSGITYAVVPSWFGVTYENLLINLITPKRREAGIPRPALLWICGGAFAVMDYAVWIPELIDLARRGYVVASVQYRTANEGEFPAALTDVKAAVRFLKANAEKFCIDRNRIAVMGESAGGTLAALAGVTSSDRQFDVGEYLQFDSSIQAVVDFYGISDLKMQTEMENNVINWQLEAFLGDHAGENEKKASVLTHISADTPPFMLLHGNMDQTVAVEQSERLYEKLTAAGVRTDYYVMDGAGHGDDAFYQAETMKLVGDFLDQVLQ